MAYQRFVRRRSVLAVVACLLVARVAASERRRLPRVGIVANSVPLSQWTGAEPASAEGPPNAAQAIRDGFKQRGWTDGKDIVLVWRSAEGRLEQLPAIFAELVRLPVDIVIAIGPGVAEALKATETTPIVFLNSAGVAEAGLVRSLARPNRNVTGFSFEAPPALDGKRLQLLSQAAPRVRRVALLGEARRGGTLPATESAAATLGLDLFEAVFDSPEDIEPCLNSALRRGADGVLVRDGVWVYWVKHQRTINRFAVRHRLPLIHSVPAGAQEGGLLGYGVDTLAGYRRLPYFVDRILKGAKPSDLPIEQPSKPELVLNLRTAKEIGLSIPAALLLQADRVIE